MVGDRKMAEKDWNRLGPEDGMHWESYNNRWDSRTTRWTSPIDWVDYQAAQLHFSYTTLFRYLTMLYYSLINLGLGEMGPSN